MSSSKRLMAVSGAVALTVAAVAGPVAQAQDPIKLGFVTHVLGNPFIQQMIDGAEAAADDLGVTLTVTGPSGASGTDQLGLIQGLADSGVQGIATSVPGATLAEPLNAIIDGGIPIVQFNLLDTGVKAPYVGERSTASGRLLGQAIVDKLGGAETATGKVAVGNCLPGFPVLENRQAGVVESLSAAPGITIVGPSDVTADTTSNYAAWEAILTANPDLVGAVGLCAFDVNSLGQLQAANAETPWVSGGYDLTTENVTQLKDGLAYISLGQTPFMQGYLPIKMLYDKLTGATDVDFTAGGFIDSGTEVAVDGTVTEPFGLPSLTYDELLELAADPAKTREFYQPLVDGVIADWASALEPVENEAK